MLNRKLYFEDLMDCYREYYNYNFLRNLRYIFDKPVDRVYRSTGESYNIYALSIDAHHYEEDNSLKRGPRFLARKSKRGTGTLAAEISYFHSLEEFKEDDISKRYYDRLFFDFDIDNDSSIKDLKTQFKEASKSLDGKSYRERIIELQDEFKKLIFEEHLLQGVFKEAKSLCEYFLEYNLKPYLVFSGSKGFHVNLFFEEAQFRNFSDISKRLAEKCVRDLGLNYLDFNVFDNKRLQRCQYSIHTKTGLYTTPLSTDVTYDEFLRIIQAGKPDIFPFKFDDYVASPQFTKDLHDIDYYVQLQKDKLREKRIKSRQSRFNVGYESGKDFSDIDCRDIASDYGLDGRSTGDKLIVSCPFHNDNHPSAVVFPNGFHCSSCGVWYNYWDFIKALYHVSDKEKIAAIARKYV